MAYILFKNDLFDNDIYENYDCLGVEEFVEVAVSKIQVFSYFRSWYLNEQDRFGNFKKLFQVSIQVTDMVSARDLRTWNNILSQIKRSHIVALFFVMQSISWMVWHHLYPSNQKNMLTQAIFFWTCAASKIVISTRYNILLTFISKRLADKILFHAVSKT